MSNNLKPILKVSNLSAYYGELRAIYDISIELNRGDVLALIGANGAGKSTMLRALVGQMSKGIKAQTRGTIEYNGKHLEKLDTVQIIDEGLTLVPEGRRLFSRMTVEDNLLCGAFLERCRKDIPFNLEKIYKLFPRLDERKNQVVSQMSGGEQQMVAIGRALMSSPSLIAFDELSLGLSPLMVEEIYKNLQGIIANGTTIILVEQDMRRALSVCTRFCVMLEGAIVMEGKPGDYSEEDITAAYFGSELKTEFTSTLRSSENG